MTRATHKHNLELYLPLGLAVTTPKIWHHVLQSGFPPKTVYQGLHRKHLVRSANLAGKAQMVVRDAAQLRNSVATRIYELPRRTEVSVQLLEPVSCPVLIATEI